MTTPDAVERESFVGNLVVFVKGAMIFVVSQAWNSAIQDLLQRTELFNNYGKVVYAIFITLASVYILKLISGVGRLVRTCQNNLFGGGKRKLAH